MYIINREGEEEELVFDKILFRIKQLCYGFNPKEIDHSLVAKKTIEGMKNGMTTTEIDILSAQVAASLIVLHSDYSKLAGRLAISNIHKNAPGKFSEAMKSLYNNTKKDGTHSPNISKEVYELSQKHAKKLNAAIVKSRDIEMYEYFGIKTLERGYMLNKDGVHVETPQYMALRMALGIHKADINATIESYHLISQKYISHATPTQFNSGTPKPQMSSCFLLTIKEDSIGGIYSTLKDVAHLSKNAGGVGISIHNVRARGSYIAGSRGHSSGIVPMLRNYNETARYVDQGGGKRKGAFAIYLEPWHADIEEFLNLKKNNGAEEVRARDLFYGLWIPDLFMKRVEENGKWSLFCPNEAPNLYNVHSEEFEKLYEKYESEGLARKTIQARDLWFKIINTQIETGFPYMLYKDACNRKSNQQNLGTIKSSNLCTEIIEYTSKDETAVCNLASIVLPTYILNGKFDFKKLHEVTKVVVRNINKIIDHGMIPIKEAITSNKKHRPMGIGVQGLADVFAILKLSFDSLSARKLNTDIFETIYHAAMEESCELAQKDGPYETFKGSPLSKGLFQFDLWHVTPDSGLYNWEELRKKVKKHGVRNSLLTCVMPTASTAQILGNNESIEPFTSNMYVRRVLSGEFIVVNKYLMKELREMNLWSEEMKNKIIVQNGSIRGIQEIPEEMKERYRTVYEISSKSIIDMAADRAVFICQSQSMNIFMKGAEAEKVTAMHFYGWKRGLKTGMYYLRNTPAREAVKFTIKNTNKQEENSKIEKIHSTTQTATTDTQEEPNICLGCGA